MNGATAHALELVYSALVDYADIVAAEDGTGEVLLRPKPTWPHGAQGLCERLIDHDGATCRATAEGARLRFPSTAAREQFLRRWLRMLDHGPYALDHEDPFPSRRGPEPSRTVMRTVDLVARDSAAAPIKRLHFETMALEDAWRRLFAREIDLLPLLPGYYRSRFTDIRSVELLEIPVSEQISLMFNTRHPHWSDVRARRELAAFIDVRAVAALACGSPDCAVTRPGRVERPTAPTLPPHIIIWVLEDRTSTVTAARVISYWLRRASGGTTTVDVVTASLEELNGLTYHSGDGSAREHDLVLLPLGILGQVSFGSVAGRVSAYTGYDAPSFLEAVAAADEDRLRAVFEDEVPVLPLYESRQFAAVDQRFCGGQPQRLTSWKWIADLRPCARSPSELQR
ncbi:hypothetical protein [Haliangium sp.]|uniref:hypothetical protein n=1 Tax=Haliangium sp. TaxID=2663208 RepID=UPI003D0F9FD7